MELYVLMSDNTVIGVYDNKESLQEGKEVTLYWEPHRKGSFHVIRTDLNDIVGL